MPEDAGASFDDLRAEFGVVRSRLVELQSEVELMKASASQQQGLVVQQASEVAQLRATAQAHATELEDMRTHRSASRDWAQLAQASGEKADRANESIRELVDRLRSEHQAEAARLRDAAEEGRALLDSRAAELQGFIRSVDREQAQGLEKARAWQAEADSRMSRLAEELGHAASEWRTDLQACRRALEGQLAVGLRETREEHRSAHGAALAEVAEVDRRGAACAAELHRLHVAAEKRLEERLGDLDELAKATARLDRALPLELEKSAGELRRLQAEASAALSGEIRSLETSFLGRCQSLEQQLSRGVEDLATRVDEVGRHSSSNLALIDQLAQRADGLDACGDELRRGLASASREAADRARADQEAAAAQLEETASCVHQRLDDLAAVMEESRQQAQDDAARALAEAEARLERRCAEAEELGRVLRGDLEASQSDSKAAVADAKAELSRRLDDRLKRAEALHAGVSEGLRGDLGALAAEVAAQARRAAQLDGCAAARLQDACDRLEGATRAQSEQTRQLGEDLRAELRQSAAFLQRRAGEEAGRLGTVERGLQAVERSLEALKRESCGAARQAQQPQTTALALPGHAVAEASPPELADLRAAVDSLACAVPALAACCGLLGARGEPAAEEVDWHGSLHGVSGLRRLLDWEQRAGSTLAARVDAAWATCPGGGHDGSSGLLGLALRKADAGSLQALRDALRDLELRVSSSEALMEPAHRRLAEAARELAEVRARQDAQEASLRAARPEAPRAEPRAEQGGARVAGYAHAGHWGAQARHRGEAAAPPADAVGPTLAAPVAPRPPDARPEGRAPPAAALRRQGAGSPAPRAAAELSGGRGALPLPPVPVAPTEAAMPPELQAQAAPAEPTAPLAPAAPVAPGAGLAAPVAPPAPHAAAPTPVAPQSPAPPAGLPDEAAGRRGAPRPAQPEGPALPAPEPPEGLPAAAAAAEEGAPLAGWPPALEPRPAPRRGGRGGGATEGGVGAPARDAAEGGRGGGAAEGGLSAPARGAAEGGAGASPAGSAEASGAAAGGERAALVPSAGYTGRGAPQAELNNMFRSKRRE